jgi:hypothetical protein
MWPKASQIISQSAELKKGRRKNKLQYLKLQILKREKLLPLGKGFSFLGKVSFFFYIDLFKINN